MDTTWTVVFVCPHGAAKSVVAAAYLARSAAARGLSVRAEAAGTEPDSEVSPAALGGLLAEGIDVRDHRPRRVTGEELAGASRIVAMGCNLGDLVPPGAPVERWDDVPPVSESYAMASAVIARRVRSLLDGLERG
jgi:protein-tyrosine-phosphatase